MPHNKPDPLIPPRKQNICPGCGKVSYSRGGVHPQCSVKLEDENRVERFKKEKPKPGSKRPTSDVKPWQKSCPKCKALMHVRKKICDCGHTFATSMRPSTDDY